MRKATPAPYMGSGRGVGVFSVFQLEAFCPASAHSARSARQRTSVLWAVKKGGKVVAPPKEAGSGPALKGVEFHHLKQVGVDVQRV